MDQPQASLKQLEFGTLNPCLGVWAYLLAFLFCTIRKYVLILSRNSFTHSVFTEHLPCSRHDSGLREYRGSHGILELKRERAPFPLFLISNMVISSPWGSCIFIISFTIFTCVSLGVPSVRGLKWFYSLSQIHFSAFHMQVIHPQLTLRYALSCPVRKEPHDFISWHCPLPSLFYSPGNSFLLPSLFSYFSWHTLPPHTGPWNRHHLLRTASTATGISGLNQCLST